ncbi:MAG: peptide ABC transporter substrate-binding protein [Chloroflexota bacterium]|nr:peptide ABC transporter substrate-binding protein [Chloroflexota bacterium]
MKKSLGFVLLLALVLALVGGVVAAQDAPKVLITGRQMGSSDIPTIDPALAEDVPSVQIIDQIFVGLGRINEESSAVEDGIATLSISEDNTVLTYSIMPEVSWVRYNADSGEVEQVLDESGNPRYVTAQDFAYGILRGLDPMNAAPYGGVLAPWIAGGSEFNAGEADASAVGINVVDTYTLEITAAQPSAVTQLVLASLWLVNAQPQWVIDEAADFWIDPENINTYGPFALKEWVRGDGGSLTMIKNPFWAGTENIPAPALDEVVFRFLDEEVQLAEFEAGTIDVAEMPDTELERVLASEALSAAYFTGPGTCTYYYGFNTERAPFDDVRARRAFSMAIDRDAMANDVLGAGQIPANLWTLPTLNAAPTSEQFPELGIFSNNEEAAALWEEYLSETGQSAADFNLTLFHNESSLHATIAQAAQQMWAETLGVTVNIATADFATYLETRGNYDIFRAAWCFDYPDSHNFHYDVPFHSDLLEENDTHWANAEYDSLIDAAFEAGSVDERIELYAQADNILVNTEAAIAPIYYYSDE